MPCSAGDKNRISSAKMMLDVQFFFALPHSDNRSPLFHPDKLFRVGMHFRADLTTGRNAH
jgi:hypothetical protein